MNRSKPTSTAPPIPPLPQADYRPTAERRRLASGSTIPTGGVTLCYVKDNESGHATGGTIYVDWPDWRGRSGKTDPSGITMLAFSIDKEKYAPGETVTTIIPGRCRRSSLGSDREWFGSATPRMDRSFAKGRHQISV